MERSTRQPAALGILALTLVLAAAGCDPTGSAVAGGPAGCGPGERISCACEDGRTGLRPCAGGACDCGEAAVLVAEPAAVIFGTLRPGEAREATVRLVNRGAVARTLQAIGLEAADAGFALASDRPATIPAGGSAQLALRFEADQPGSRGAVLVVAADGATLRVPVQALVAGPVLSCAPALLSLPDALLGSPATGSVACASVGVGLPGIDATVHVERLDLSGSAEFAAAVRGGIDPAGYPPGTGFAIEVAHRPADLGLDTGSLEVVAAPASGWIELAGRGVEAVPCDLAYPAEFRLGIVPRSKVFEVPLKNRRPDAACRISDVRLAPETDPAWTLEPIAETVLGPDETLSLALRYEAGGNGATAGGAILFDVEHPVEPHRRIGLPAVEHGPCVVVEPGHELSFGTVVPECGVAEREVRLSNVCDEPFRVLEVYLENAWTEEDFFVRSEPMPGTELRPGETIPIKLGFRPHGPGSSRAALFVQLEGAEVDPVGLHGRGEWEWTTEDFVQLPRAKVDLLVVLDNGTGMAAWSDRVLAELGRLPELVSPHDFHLAVTTTGLAAQPGAGCPGGAAGGEDGRLFPVDGTRPRIVTAATPDALAVWEANLQVGTCQAAPPQPLEAALRALTPPLSTSADDPRHPAPADGNLGFLRPDAFLSVIVVSDRVDASPRQPGEYWNDLLAIKGTRNPQLFNFHAITGARGSGCTTADGRTAAPGGRLIDVVERSMGGVFASICGTGWLDPLYGSGASGLKTCFFLDRQPLDVDGDGGIDDDDLDVKVDGEPIPEFGADGRPSWTFNPDSNGICFYPGHVPTYEAAVQVGLVAGCQGP